MQRSSGRDREAREREILAAAKEELAAVGFQGFGVNAVARRAGCDKQLIYRYFDGLEGLVDAIGADLGSWVADRLAPLEALGPPASYGELVERLLLGYLHALRQDPLMQRIIAWEIADSSPHVRRLTEVRSRALAQWVAGTRGALVPPPGLDAPAMNALLIAAVQHVVLAAAQSGQFAGVDLTTDDGFERIRVMIRRIVRGLAGEP